MKFCSACGASVDYKVPEDDSRERAVCSNCGAIHYQNPKVVTGTLPIWGDQVLLCKRAIEPRRGYWTLPAGYMENGETAETGGARETMEEANASVENPSLYTVFSLPHISQVYMFFKADLVGPTYSSGSESLEVALFSEHEIPWDELAFPTVRELLREFLEDRKTGQYPIRNTVIEYPRR